VIVLIVEFFGEVMAHPIPTDMDAVKLVVSAPAVLDVFMWLVYRCFVAKQEEQIPLFGEFDLTAQLESVEYTRPRFVTDSHNQRSRRHSPTTTGWALPCV
jgi:hypothetical protein